MKQLPDYRLVAAVNCVLDFIPERPFKIDVTNASRKVAHIPKHMVTAGTTEPLTVIHTICNEFRTVSRLKTSEEYNKADRIPDNNDILEESIPGTKLPPFNPNTQRSKTQK